MIITENIVICPLMANRKIIENTIYSSPLDMSLSFSKGLFLIPSLSSIALKIRFHSKINDITICKKTIITSIKIFMPL